MSNFRVYRITRQAGEVECIAFSETFLNSPWLIGGCTFESFLPIDGRKHYQEVSANDEDEAIKIAQDRLEGCWLWSRFNWGLEEDEDELASVTTLSEIIPRNSSYITQINAQLNTGFKKSLDLVMDTKEQKTCFSRL